MKRHDNHPPSSSSNSPFHVSSCSSKSMNQLSARIKTRKQHQKYLIRVFETDNREVVQKPRTLLVGAGNRFNSLSSRARAIGDLIHLADNKMILWIGKDVVGLVDYREMKEDQGRAVPGGWIGIGSWPHDISELCVLKN